MPKPDRCPLCFAPLVQNDARGLTYCQDNSDHYRREDDGATYVMGVPQ